MSAVVDTLLLLANDRSVAPLDTVSAELPTVYADFERIVQVLSHLVGNAIKFSEAGGIVRIAAQTDDNAVTVEITDSGMGINADELAFVFDRFWQSKRTNRSGAGLGLAIAHGIVRAHRGDITVASTPGEGSPVRFTLPLIAPQAPPLRPPDASAPQVSDEKSEPVPQADSW